LTEIIECEGRDGRGIYHWWHVNVSNSDQADRVKLMLLREHTHCLDSYLLIKLESPLGLNLDFRPEHWNPINRSQGEDAAYQWAENGMAYSEGHSSKRTLLPDIDKFFQAFGDKANWYTNWNFLEESNQHNHDSSQDEAGAGWFPYTNATFDFVLGVVDGGRVGILLIEDED
jgi:hypothetical protein